MKKTMSLLLMITGIILLTTPFIMTQLIKHQKSTIMDGETLKEQVNHNIDEEGEFDYSAVTDVNIWSLIEDTKTVDKRLIIGTISIPDLGIHLPILKGLSNSNLVVGAATMKEDQSFGAGNFTLSGHNMKNKKLLFGSLMDIQIGSMVYISDGEKTYHYEIYETIVVPDDAMDMLADERADEKGKPIISLMTCYYSSKTGKRFFALGELIDEELDSLVSID